VCGDCNKPTLKPVAFWDRTYAYDFYCEECGVSHYDLLYAEFQGTHPWQLGVRDLNSNMESDKPWKPLWAPKKKRDGEDIELSEALKLPSRIMELREDLASHGVRHGVLRYSVPETELNESIAQEIWESNSEGWIESARFGDGDPNRLFVIDPALWSLLGDVSGLSVLDAGCGNGYLTRLLATKGANVTGMDYSRTFIDYCTKVEVEMNLGCKFLEASVTDMKEVESKSFDIVVSNVVLVDVLDYKTAFKEIARVLKDDGRFIWSNTHPIFGRSATGGDFRFPRDSRRNESRYLKMIDRYFDSGGELVAWWTSPTWQFIRTLEEYSKALKDAGLVISEIVEPRPSIEDIQKNPDFLAFDADRWTHFIIFECLKRKMK